MDTTNYLLLECRQCNMKFETQRDFNTHIDKFCIRSEYGTIPSLLNKLEESDKNKATNKYHDNVLSINEVNHYVNSERVPEIQDHVRDMDLYNTRNNLKVTEDKYSKINDEYDTSHRKVLRNELNEIHIERQKARIQRKQNETAMEHFLREIDVKKDKISKGINEKDDIEKALRDLDNKKTYALDVIKKAELRKVKEERHKIKLKEDLIQKEIDHIRAQGIQLENDPNLKSTDADARENQIKKNYKDLQNDHINLYRVQGEDVASIRNRKELLKIEREKIIDDMEKLKNGDLNAARKNKVGQMAAAYILNKPGSTIDLKTLRD